MALHTDRFINYCWFFNLVCNASIMSIASFLFHQNHNNRNEQQSHLLERQAGLLNQRSQGLKEVDKRIAELKELMQHRQSSSQSLPLSTTDNKNNSNSRGQFSNGAVPSRGKFYSTSQRSVPPDGNGQYDSRYRGQSNYYPLGNQDGQNGRRSSPLSNGSMPPDTNGNGSWAKPVIMTGGRPGDGSNRHQLSSSPATSPLQNRHPIPQPRRPPPMIPMDYETEMTIAVVILLPSQRIQALIVYQCQQVAY